MRAATVRSIVLATDGSGDAVGARRAVADIARLTGAAVHVVGVWRFVPRDLPSELHDDMHARVRAECRALQAAGASSVRAHVVCGRVARSILRVADTVDADLVVVGSGGHGALGRLLVGSVSDEVVRRSSRPVLVVRGCEDGWPPMRVVAGHDGSVEASEAVRLAALLARCAGARLTILDVLASASEATMGELRLALDAEFIDRRGAIPGPADVRLSLGEAPARTLLHLASGTPPAALAVGRRGIGRIREAVHGSVSARLVHAAPGAVLVVPHRQASEHR